MHVDVFHECQRNLDVGNSTRAKAVQKTHNTRERKKQQKTAL